MIAAWMLHGVLVAFLIGLGALAVEHAARALRLPARFIWLGALLGTTLLAAAQLRPSASTLPGFLQPRADAAASAAAPAGAGGSHASLRALDGRGSLLRQGAIAIPGWAAAFDRPLLIIWGAASLVWGVLLIGSAGRLWRQRADWRPLVMDDVPLYMSHDVGPALFGMARYSIVVPSWFSDLAADQRRLILAHEREHARAADPVVLLAGALVVLLQPWNPAIWLLFQRLRFAIEADCDARVLTRSTDVRAYGEVLLDVGERVLAGAAPVAALSEPRSHLARRIALMTQLPIRRPLLRSAAALAVAGVLAMAACQVPRPVMAPNGSDTALAIRNEAGHGPSSRVDAQDATQAGRVLVRLTSVGLVGSDTTPTILVFAEEPARVRLGTAAAVVLSDTLRLHSLPAMTLDVTDSDVHLQLLGAGQLRIGGDVTGGPAQHLSATGRHLVVLKGGIGVSFAQRQSPGNGSR